MMTVTMDQARRLFSKWRKSRPHSRSAAPLELRRVAVAMKRRHGGRINQEKLGLSSNTLWGWQREAAASDAMNTKPPVAVRRASLKQVLPKVVAAAGIKFVEITPSPSARQMDSRLAVEWQRSDGVRMKVSGTSLDLAGVEQLAQHFLSARERRPS